jgi:iron complex transport system substrate-binding protein
MSRRLLSLSWNQKHLKKHQINIIKEKMMKHRISITLALMLLLLSSITIVAQGETACEGGFRLFNHELLATDPVCVPENPQRIAVQDIAAAELMYALDIEPIAIAADWVNALFGSLPAPLGPELLSYYENIPSFGGFEINLEALLEAQPDLILLNTSYSSPEIVDELSLIAPVIVTDTVLWKDITAMWGEALNRTEDTEAILTNYENRVSAFKEITENQYVGMSLALVMYSQGETGTISPHLPGGISWIIPNDLGFIPPTALPQTPDETLETFDSPYPQISLEELPILEADFIVLMSGSYSAEEFEAIQAQYDTLRDNPLWQVLSAVQEEKFYFTGPHWLANGIIEAHVVLDEAFGFFTDVNVQDVAPNPFLTATEVEDETADDDAFVPVQQVEGFPPFTPDPVMVEVIENRGDTLLVRHGMGETEIPASPERIYTDASTTQIALSLGIEPVGVQYFTNIFEIPGLEEALDGVEVLGTNTYDPNFAPTGAGSPTTIVGAIWLSCP